MHGPFAIACSAVAIAAACAPAPKPAPTTLAIASPAKAAAPPPAPSTSAPPAPSAAPMPRDRVATSFLDLRGGTFEWSAVTAVDPLDLVASCWTSDPGAGWMLLNVPARGGEIGDASVRASEPRDWPFAECVAKALRGARYVGVNAQYTVLYVSVSTTR